jgi:F-type H+-transporting ATPase subunit delta
MVAGSLSRRYARALLEIGIRTESYDALGKELERLMAQLQGAPELKQVLENKVFPLDGRRQVLDEVARRLGLSRTLRNFAVLVLEKGRITALPDIARAYQTLVDQHAGRVRATVTSAGPLDPAFETRLKHALEKQSGKVVLLEKREDPSLIGGVVTQLGDLMFDGSVRTQLERLREELLSES